MKLKCRCLPAFAGMAAGLLAMRGAGATIVVDSFQITPDRPLFSGLNGQGTEGGAEVWTASADLQLQPSGNGGVDGAIGTATGGNPFGADGFAIVPLTYSSGIADVHAQLHPVSTIDPTHWIAIGFGNGSNIVASGNPWALLRANGAVQLFGGPGMGANSVTAAPGGEAYVYNVNDYNLVDLTYNSATNLTTLVVNGTPAANLTVSSPGTINSAGFAFYGQDVVTSVTPAALDNFSASAPAVPEPGAAALLTGCAALLTRRRCWANAPTRSPRHGEHEKTDAEIRALRVSMVNLTIFV